MLSPGVCDRKDVRSGPPGSRRYKMGHDKSCPISRIGMAALFVDTVFGFEALQRSGTKPAKGCGAQDRLVASRVLTRRRHHPEG